MFIPFFISPNKEVEVKQDDGVAGQLYLSHHSHNCEPDKTSSPVIVVAKDKFVP